jgi:SPP1 gp7 family putative phage head morphogenesis protein
MNDWEVFAARRTVASDRFSNMDHSEKLRAFSVTCDATVEQLERVKNALVENYRRGGTFADFKKAVKNGDFGEIGALPSYRLENIYRTNVMGAYMRGRYLEQEEDANVFPYLLYVAVQDSRTRPNHMALNGLIVRFGSEEANLIYPPNGFQCRCMMRAMTKMEADAMGGPTPEAEVRRRIAENPPDKGWEGPPFMEGEGGAKGGLQGSLEKTEDRMKAEGARTASAEDVAELLEKVRDSPEAAREAKATVSESSLGPVKAAEASVKFDVASKTSKDPEWTQAERKTQAKIRADIRDRMIGEGLLRLGAGLGEMKAKMKDIVNAMFKNGSGRGLKEALAFYGSQDRREEILAKRKDILGQLEILKSIGDTGTIWLGDLYSAEQMKFLDEEMILALNFHTDKGDQYTRNVLQSQKKGDREFDAVAEYYKAVGIIEDVVAENVSNGPPIDLYRAFSDYPDSTGTRGIREFLEEFERTGVSQSFRLDYNASFAEARKPAEEFGKEPGSIFFKLRTSAGLRIGSISAKPGEVERLVMGGKAFKPVGFKRLADDKIEVEVVLLEKGTEPAWRFACLDSITSSRTTPAPLPSTSCSILPAPSCAACSTGGTTRRTS